VASGNISLSKRLSGKVCIIKGTGGSMGRAAASIFAREGALVVGCDLQADVKPGTRYAMGNVSEYDR
jgi:NAD(P)-dependent dehydrogenase (short-subunit alcohol dehydrogenase family)